MNLKKIWIYLFFGLVVFSSFSTARSDTTTVFLSDTIAYQGHIQTQIPVYIDNIDQNIGGFELGFTIIPNDRVYFTTDHFEVYIDTVCSDTIVPCPPDKIIRIDTTISRIAKVDRTGSLTSNFPWFAAHGDVGDTSSKYCVNLNVVGVAPTSQPIGPGFGVLFKIYLDFLCIPDSLLPDTMVFISVYGTLAQADTLIKEKRFLQGRYIILTVKYGDNNGDNKISVGDVVYLINYLLKGGPSPNPQIKGDASGDGKVSITDVVYLINFLFKSGPPPRCYGI
jgi:hypothetical protein